MTSYLDKESLWFKGLNSVFQSPDFHQLEEILSTSTSTIYPPKEEIFAAFQLTSLENTKVVILGQDPYHGEKQGNGLAFSVNRGIKIPPSLRNIYKELEDDLGITAADHGDLSAWAREGVLLLNSCLSVEAGKANSHRGIGWEKVTDRAISLVNELDHPVVFMLWGSQAMGKQSLITHEKHLILTSVHPSPLSAYRGFLGCKHFSKTNQFLLQQGMKEISWDNRG